VDEDQAAVDEGAEVHVPADPRLVFGNLAVPSEPDLRRIVLLRHGEEVVETGEVDDLAVVGGCDLGHGGSPRRKAKPLPQPCTRRNASGAGLRGCGTSSLGRSGVAG
jgi:hypothetical protein